jgi:N-acetylglucosamine kinase-like BadF-type ATPase
LAVASHTNNRVTRYSTTGTVVDAFDQATPDGIGWATGDVLWVSNAGSHSVAKWDEVTSAAGYGEAAVEIDGSVGTYLGIGNRDGFVQNVGTGTKTGGLDVTCTVRAFAKATSGTATFKGLVLSARAIARR